MNNFIIGSTLICKKDYLYNGSFCAGDEFIIISYNDYNVRLKTPIETFHNITYNVKNVILNRERYLWDLFYTPQEMREMKIKTLID